LLQDRTGWSPHDIAGKVEALIVTRGGKGSYIYHKDKRIDIPAAPVSGIVDPTGCGDAFRGGLLYGLMNGLDWEITGRMAALMGAIKIEQHGTQNHSFTLDEFRNRYREAFGAHLEAL
jgi:adenosine kinase